MSSDDGSVVISYNGEIYHFAKLRDELERLGRKFVGNSDSEVVANGIAQWGIEETCRRIDGMFAIAAWMPREKRLFLARDRLGKKPLYFSRVHGRISFASEIAAINQDPEMPKILNVKAAAGFLNSGFVADDKTIFESIEKVSPGHIFAFDIEGRLNTSAYWRLTDVISARSGLPRLTDTREALSIVRGQLHDAVEQRMVADVPYGAFLSGGIDSSLIVGMMQRISKSKIKTFSIGYKNSSLDEAEDAKAIAAHLGTDHTTFYLNANDALDMIYRLPSLYSEPFADPSQIPTAIISRLAREHVKVVLTGDGGDEVFGGYNRHVAARGMLSRIDRLPRGVTKSLSSIMQSLSPTSWDRLFAIIPKGMRPRQAGEKMHKLAALLKLPEIDRYTQYTSQWSNAADYLFDVPDVCPGSLLEPIPEFDDVVERLRYFDLLCYLPGDILAKVDRASMAFGLETRSPLLDYRLIETSFRISSDIHIQGGKGKKLLRLMLEEHVPSAMFERPKSGFGVPIGDWLKTELRDWAEQKLSVPALDKLGFVKSENVHRLWREHLAGKANAQYPLWNILMLQSWLEHQQIPAERT